MGYASMPMLILVDVWEWVPFVALMAPAGLRALPASPIEAARITGGGPGSSMTVNDLFQYWISFANFDLSYGAALGLVTFAAMLIVTGLTFRTITRSAVSS
jgi:multiple sugar transport system permease protein